MFVTMCVCADADGQLDDMAWLRHRKKRAVSLGGGLCGTMRSLKHSRSVIDTQCVAFVKGDRFFHE